MTAVAQSTITAQEAAQFLFREARLADTHDYDAWEALWTDDAIYWVPAGGESAEDPTSQVSVLFDNRSRIGTRIRQLKSGKRHSQTPKSNVVHVLGNVEVLGPHDGANSSGANSSGADSSGADSSGADSWVPDSHAGDTLVAATLLAVESRERGTQLWAGRCEYRLRRVEGEVRMSWKKVLLVDRDQPLFTLSFLI